MYKTKNCNSNEIHPLQQLKSNYPTNSQISKNKKSSLFLWKRISTIHASSPKPKIPFPISPKTQTENNSNNTIVIMHITSKKNNNLQLG